MYNIYSERKKPYGADAGQPPRRGIYRGITLEGRGITAFNDRERYAISKQLYIWIAGLNNKDYSEMAPDELSDIVGDSRNRLGIAVGEYARKDETNFEVKWTLFCKAEEGEAPVSSGSPHVYHAITMTTSAVIHMNGSDDDPDKWSISFYMNDTAVDDAGESNGEGVITDMLEPHMFNIFDVEKMCEAFWLEVLHVDGEWAVDSITRNKDDSYDIRWHVLSKTDAKSATIREEPKLTHAVVINQIFSKGSIMQHVLLVTDGKDELRVS